VLSLLVVYGAVDAWRGTQYVRYLSVPQALAKLALGAPQVIQGGRFFDAQVCVTAIQVTAVN
jgi:hypothetical protein